MPPFECLVPPKVDFLGYKLIMCISYIVTHIYIISMRKNDHKKEKQDWYLKMVC